VSSARDNFYAHFQTLTYVRDSSHHLEDRIRGRRRGDIKIDLKPINIPGFMKSYAGVLALDNLNNNRYGSTMANGNYGEVEVSIDSLNKARDCIQETIDAFEWEGFKAYHPQY
jgi:hypothetical protein